ncbi:MAG: TadE/TadG family type IV pilus assembly protein [Hyphomonas sp.]
MTISKIFSPVTRKTKWRGIRGLCYNEDGISAVEFALIAPFMAMLYMGCIELSFMMRADRRITSTSASMGDLTSRLATVEDADMQEIYQAALVIMRPLDASTARMRITSIVDDGSGTTTVDWSDAHNMAVNTKGAPITVPSGIISSGGSVIMAEVEYEYNSTFAFVFDASRTMSDTFYLRPRKVNAIPRVQGSGSSDGFGPAS